MELISIKCVNCGAEIKTDSIKEKVRCEYCGSDFFIKGAEKPPAPAGTAPLVSALEKAAKEKQRQEDLEKRLAELREEKKIKDEEIKRRNQEILVKQKEAAKKFLFGFMAAVFAKIAVILIMRQIHL